MPIISKITLPDNTTYDVTDGRGMFVGSCSTAAATQTKDVSISTDQNFVLRIGAVIAVKFTYSNTYKSTTSAPCKMNVNGTGAKNIYWVNTATPNNTTSTIAFGTAGYYHFYLYDGSNWVWVGYSNESNTTYSGMTTAEIEAGTSTTNRLISPANLKTAIQTLGYVHDSIQVNLNDITWSRSGGGLYYSSTITIPDSPVVLLYHATLSGFANLRATDIITPACRRTAGWSGFVLYANTNEFLTNAWVTVSVSGLPYQVS